jgi:kynurenine formamidase
MNMLSTCEVIDLTHSLEVGMPAHPEHSRYFHELWNSYWHGDQSVTYQIMLNEHSGTHADAPAHFVREGKPNHSWIDQLSPTALWGPSSVIDVREYAGATTFAIDVLERFEAMHGTTGKGDVVLFTTGWSDKWAVRPGGRDYLYGWPGPTEALCRGLVDRQVAAVGCDNMGLDADGAVDAPAHMLLLGSGIPIIENLNGLDRLPERGGVFMAMPLLIQGGSGSPIRAVCLLPRGNENSDRSATGELPKVGWLPWHSRAKDARFLK